MLKQNKLKTQHQQNLIMANIIYLILFMVIFLLHLVDLRFNIGISKYNVILLIGNISLICFQLILSLIRNRIYKGIKYAICHYTILFNVRRSLLDANYYNKRLYLNNEIADLPRVKLSFSKNMFKGKLLIENIKINKDFKNLNISPALKDFIVERYYLSNDENYHVFEIYDSNISQQIKFNNFNELKEYSSTFDDYTLFIDENVEIPLCGSLFVGQTGSGKTYALYSLILQMISKKTKYNLHFADPKNSSLAVLGERISSENTATNIDEIIDLLRKFNDYMQKRKLVLKNKLATKLEATYADFNLEPHVLIFDEFASFQTVLKTMEKKRRDEVEGLLSETILQGRQLGFVCYFVMQKSDATNLPTYLRENLLLKVVLGNAEQQTYITAFGTGVDIPDKDFQLGQGVFTCPVIANTPKICHFSYLDFDILASVGLLK